MLSPLIVALLIQCSTVSIASNSQKSLDTYTYFLSNNALTTSQKFWQDHNKGIIPVLIPEIPYYLSDIATYSAFINHLEPQAQYYQYSFNGCDDNTIVAAQCANLSNANNSSILVQIGTLNIVNDTAILRIIMLNNTNKAWNSYHNSPQATAHN